MPRSPPFVLAMGLENAVFQIEGGRPGLGLTLRDRCAGESRSNWRLVWQLTRRANPASAWVGRICLLWAALVAGSCVRCGLPITGSISPAIWFAAGAAAGAERDPRRHQCTASIDKRPAALSDLTDMTAVTKPPPRRMPDRDWPARAILPRASKPLIHHYWLRKGSASRAAYFDRRPYRPTSFQDFVLRLSIRGFVGGQMSPSPTPKERALELSVPDARGARRRRARPTRLW